MRLGAHVLLVVAVGALAAGCGSSEKHPSSTSAGGTGGAAGTGGSPGGSSGAGTGGGGMPPMQPPVTGDFGAYTAWAGQTESTKLPVTPNAAQPAIVPGVDSDRYDAFAGLIAQGADGTPHVEHLTYLGGSGLDAAAHAIADRDGNLYVVGRTESADFPVKNPLQPTLGGEGDLFVAKYAKTGELLFATYLGGSDYEEAQAIALDATGLYIVGRSASPDFPVTPESYQPVFGGAKEGFATFNAGGDAIALKLALDGTKLLWSTYLGGDWSEGAAGLFVNDRGEVYVTGSAESLDFPTTEGAFQTELNGPPSTSNGLFFNYDMFLAKLSATGSELLFCTLVGGTLTDFGGQILPQADGSLLVLGSSDSGDFPLAAPREAGQRTYLARLSGDGRELRQVLTFAPDVWPAVLQQGPAGLYLAGAIQGAGFGSAGTLQPSIAGDLDGFIARLAPDAMSVDRYTYFGGTGWDTIHAMAFDAAGRVHVLGNFAAGAQPVKGAGLAASGGVDLYWAALQPDLGALDFATYVGGPDDDYGTGRLTALPSP